MRRPPSAVSSMRSSGSRLMSTSCAGVSICSFMMVPLASPIFTVGQHVRLPFWGRMGVVARDLGGDTVDVSDERPAPPLGKHAKQTFVTPINRGALVASNLSTIVKQLPH
jgi:hypothetical protein